MKYQLSGAYFGYPRIPNEGQEGLGDVMIARTLYIDRIIHRVVGDMDQFVVLGAGYDTRAYGELKREELGFFEAAARGCGATLEVPDRARLSGVVGDPVRTCRVLPA